MIVIVRRQTALAFPREPLTGIGSIVTAFRIGSRVNSQHVIVNLIAPPLQSESEGLGGCKNEDCDITNRIHQLNTASTFLGSTSTPSFDMMWPK